MIFVHIAKSLVFVQVVFIIIVYIVIVFDFFLEFENPLLSLFIPRIPRSD
eukprot:UN19045